ncbi:MAG: hypothetical protein MRJ68_19130 [Nitrospira sp.]|nr:hypothetical protein [Nitrospira sp.]
MTPFDFERTELVIGDTVIFQSAPHFLQRGTIVGFFKVRGSTMGAEIVTDSHPNYVHKVQCSVCAKVSDTLPKKA